MAITDIMGYVLDGGGPKDSENTLNSFLTKRNEDWTIFLSSFSENLRSVNDLIFMRLRI